MPGHRLSAEAEQDVEDTTEFGVVNFGRNQAIKYHSSILRTIEILALFPRIGLPSYDLREGLYRFPHKSHMIFYTHEPDHIRIVRILHASADFKRIFGG